MRSSRPAMAVSLAALLCAMLVIAPALAVRSAPAPQAAIDADPTLRYIVELDDPPLAQYAGGIGKLAPTAPSVTGDAHLDLTSRAARAYLHHLDLVQTQARARIRTIAPAARFDWGYRYVFNGFAATLRVDEARQVRRLAGVRAVTVEERLEPELDASLPVIGAPAAFEAVGGIAEAGLGARFAIVDSGTDSLHTMFRDDGMPPAPAGYPTATMHLRDGTVVPYPNAGDYVNGKLIAARIFVAPEVIGDTPIVTALAQIIPLGQDHGLHVSGIAAGREGTYQATTNNRPVPVTLSGVAPKAHVLNYKANYASTPEYVAMLDQMVVDEVDALNMSQGHVGWLLGPTTDHPMRRAFEGASDAGIVVVISAGNAGVNGATSLSGVFKYSEKVIAVGNASTSGTYDVRVSLTGAGRPTDVLLAAPRGNYTHTAPISGDLVYVADGGCAASPGVNGKIAVLDRMGTGTCTYEQRNALMRASGAIGVIHYYNERKHGGLSTTVVPLPVVGVGLDGGREFMAWMRSAPADARATISNEIVRGAGEIADLLEGGSSRGPGLDWSIKPDISAPGSNILSSQVTRVGERIVPIIALMGGTSMSSPHVAGAATLVRSAHPDWTSEQVRSALLTASSPTIGIATGITSSVPAAPYEGGVGRLNVAGAIDPGAFLHPSKLSFGGVTLADGETATRQIAVRLDSASAQPETWLLAVDPITGTAPIVAPTTLSVAPGASGMFTVALSVTAPTQAEHWGHVTLRRSETATPLHLAYYLHVDERAARKNVLLVNWTWGVAGDDTLDYAGYYTRTLDSLALSYDVWNIDDAPASAVNRRAHPTLGVMKRYDLVIVNANESRYPLQPTMTGMPYGFYAYQNYLLGGGNMLLVGQGEMNWWRFLSKTRYGTAYQTVCAGTWPKCMLGASQNVGCEMCLPRYFAGFTFGVTDTLAGRVLDYPERPERRDAEVLLLPHPDADGAFSYTLDISTGALAKEDAAGNQYTFASGDVLGEYVPGGDTWIEGRDYSYAEGVIDLLGPFARPLWSYTGPFENEVGEMETDTRVVGTYVAGRQDTRSHIAWNAMFWGFGLEGVGRGAEATIGRERLLGDAFNFLARNVRTDWIEPAFDRMAGLRLAFPEVSDVPVLASAEIDWGDGTPIETFAFDPPVAADVAAFAHDYASDGAYEVTATLLPVSDAAPVHEIRGTIHGTRMARLIYLPAALDSAPLVAAR